MSDLEFVGHIPISFRRVCIPSRLPDSVDLKKNKRVGRELSGAYTELVSSSVYTASAPRFGGNLRNPEKGKRVDRELTGSYTKLVSASVYTISTPRFGGS